ncbi:hypothetical protein AVEN_199127-1 [Araneus ventricosus]|uniref:Uncharacterized protein n=1 Tax=Araneus ventricosus TaxID=182803 RepID=A0A4Y2S3M3_ARAVE|nr:hypothetical protein AVEN_199127-1 [Araneus ventricosus]
MELETEEDQEGTKDAYYTIFASKSFQLPTFAVQMRLKLDTTTLSSHRYLWHFISSSRYLPKKYRDIIEPVISRNSYFTAPGNMLLAMLTDERCHIRTLAARRMVKARKIGPDGINVRRFFIPAVNFGVTDCVYVTDWQASYVTSPPVPREISSHELLKMIQDDVPTDG